MMHSIVTEKTPLHEVVRLIENHKKRGKGRPVESCLVCACPARTKGLCQAHYFRYRKYGDPRTRRLIPSGEKKSFADKMVAAFPLPTEECVLWPFPRMNTGYGAFQSEGQEWTAHRYICQQVHGQPSDRKMEAAHSCGNGQQGCVSPNHLRWATRQENVFDRVGHRTNNPLITDAMVSQIRAMAGSRSHRAIGEVFGVSQSHVSSIIAGKVRASR